MSTTAEAEPWVGSATPSSMRRSQRVSLYLDDRLDRVTGGLYMAPPPAEDRPLSAVDPGRVSTGIAGLDDILGGGVDADRLYLIEGRPGTGKTTLALHFLIDGVRRGEKCLYVTLSESESELRLVAARHGWSLDEVSIFELVPPEASLDPEREQTLFHPSEMELGETTKLIIERVNDI